ncbi:MAG: spiro-SPASM protein [Treponema sp.]|nr:spiro-SPASM protein [Treponema sp.]
MKALCVLYGGRLTQEAFEEQLPGQGGQESAFDLALKAVRRFQGVEKILFFGIQGLSYPSLPGDIEGIYRPSWNKLSFLEELSRQSAGYELTYLVWADCPLLDSELASTLALRHLHFYAQYTYADGWPYGFAPEILAPGVAGILAALNGDDQGPVERDLLFSVIQKDINAFDIETEISGVDLRPYRLNLAADSKRNLLLVKRLMDEGLRRAEEAEGLIKEKGHLLRTLPAFFAIQVSSACPQSCALCPYPSHGPEPGSPASMMDPENFARLLDKIRDFAGDGVIDLSLWGELSLHPERLALIQMVLDRPELSLVIESSGIGWKNEELIGLAEAAGKAAPRLNRMAGISWIVSLDAHDQNRYKEIRGPGYAEAYSCAEQLLSLFPQSSYVQALRVKDFEDDIEQFYRTWKDKGPPSNVRPPASHVIIQKYDHFAGALPRLQASDLSPVKRRPCWHLQRDMNILIDGSLIQCREDLGALRGSQLSYGNVFTEELPVLWEKGEALYREHTGTGQEEGNYPELCRQCDEYYTFNF